MDQSTYHAKFAAYQKLIGAGAFPKTFKGTVNQLIALSQNPQAGAKDLACIVSSDPAISTKVITVVNSPFYGLNSEVSNLAQAIALLGFEETKKIALSVSVFEGFKRSDVLELLRVWRHSICVAIFSRIVAEHIRRMEAEAYTAGLLHDIGKILLFSVNPQAAKTVQNNYLYERGRITYLDAENQLLGIDHTWIGYCAACQWNLPPVMREAIFAHHNPNLNIAQSSGMLARIIHISDNVAIASGYPSYLSSAQASPKDSLLKITDQLLGSIGLNEPGFKEIMDEIKSTGIPEARNFMSVVESSVSRRSA
ncbi:MAG: HDOD domain-containing protein [Armatimonadetes bacterium]|nr:HDOD domain-containing protein [Armatimonadota bacterium]